MEIEKKVSEFKSLTKVVSRVDLNNIYMSNCNAERKPDALEHDKLEAKISIKGDLLSKVNNDFNAIVKFSVEGRSGKDPEYIVVKIENEYVLNYSLKSNKDLTKSDLEAFCSINAVYNAWPYWREFVQNMTNRMEMPVLTLPLLKFRPPNKRKKESEKTK